MTELKSKILDWVELRIAGDPDFTIPLKKLREELVDGLAVPVPSLEEIIGWLEEDGRFDVMAEGVSREGLPAGPPAMLEQMGFYDGPRTGLKAKRPTREQIIERLEENSTRLLQAIQKGYAEGKIDEESFDRFEGQLLEFLQHTRKLKEG